jgi:hypothetical protein
MRKKETKRRERLEAQSLVVVPINLKILKLATNFSPTPLYPPLLFQTRFQMHQELFLSIVDDVTEYDNYFLLKKDVVGQLGLHPIQKVTLALRMLAYGGSADSNDKYIQISESTSLESLTRFCDAIINIYSEEYL